MAVNTTTEELYEQFEVVKATFDSKIRELENKLHLDLSISKQLHTTVR